MISTTGLTFRYPKGATLVFPDLNIAQGQVMLLSGPSGCGKSTLLALIAGLLDPSEGNILVAGESIRKLSPARMDRWRSKNIGFLTQKLHLSDALNVYQNLALVYFAAGLAENRIAIEAAMSALGIASIGQRKPDQISGGQAQRVALARAVLLQPKLILADEPTASLDDANARDALHLLQTTAQRCAATLVIATHDARVKQALPDALSLEIH